MSDFEPIDYVALMSAKLEPEADYAESRNGPYVTALTSIAVSLKRIADLMESRPQTEDELQADLEALAKAYGVGP